MNNFTYTILYLNFNVMYESCCKYKASTFIYLIWILNNTETTKETQKTKSLVIPMDACIYRQKYRQMLA